VFLDVIITATETMCTLATLHLFSLQEHCIQTIYCEIYKITFKIEL